MSSLYDFLGTYENGINSDLHPSLLPKNVAAWTINSTLRGGFPRPRPPLFRRTLIFPSDDVQTAVETGFFQGAGYYRPDFGSPQLVAQIGGRLFTFTPGAGDDWNVVEITIPGDPNDATTNQVWMNQAEKWLIITDGTARLPIFWDGVTARRSYGPSVQLGIATAFNPAAPPAIGDTVQVTLQSPYTGEFNIPVLFNGEYYQTAQASSGYAVTAIPGLKPDAPFTLLENAAVTVRSDVVGFCSATSNVAHPTFGFRAYVRIVAGNNTVSVNEKVIAGGYTFNVSSLSVAITPPQSAFYNSVPELVVTLDPVAPGTPGTALAGNYVYRSNVTQPSVIIGNLITGENLVANQVSASISIDRAFEGPAGQTVIITDSTSVDRLFILNPVAAPPPGNTLYLVNLTDTSAAAYVNPLTIMSVPELPAGRMGAYGLGHQAMSLVDGISFIYGDAVGGPSGTPANNYRDSVLKTTENTFLEGGGFFRIPNSGEIITSMTFTAVLDAAYGQGPLLLGTPTAIYSCAVPTDRSEWILLTNPILTEVLIGKGPLGQNSTIAANSDTLFRFTEGMGSLIFGRRDFETWGNTPISAEVNRTVSRDIRSLLSYGSAVTFDNRFLSTVAPQVSGQGVYHIGTVALNFDPVSSLRGKAPSIWESLWTGTNVLQYLVGNFNSTERCFQFTFNERDQKIELWEQLRSDAGEYFDNGDTRIQWVVETPCIFKPEERPQNQPIVRLNNGKIHVDQVVGTVHIRVLWKPDFYPCWTLWHEFDICATVDSSNPDSQPGYRSPLGLGTPSVDACEEKNNRPLRSGRFHQLRFEITGQCVLMGGEFEAVPEPTITFPSPICCEIVSENLPT